MLPKMVELCILAELLETGVIHNVPWVFILVNASSNRSQVARSECHPQTTSRAVLYAMARKSTTEFVGVATSDVSQHIPSHRKPVHMALVENRAERDKKNVYKGVLASKANP